MYVKLFFNPCIAIWALMLCSANCIAQEKEKFRPEHSVGINIGHEHAFHGIDQNGETKTAVLPYWGVDYNFQFARKFALGLHVDVITESFEVEKHLEGDGETVVERKMPVAPALMGFFKPGRHWSLGLGMGVELEQEENYVLNRAAVEYSAEISKGWEVFGVFQYDIRWKAYDTWTIGLGIGKTFGKKSGNDE